LAVRGRACPAQFLLVLCWADALSLLPGLVLLAHTGILYVLKARFAEVSARRARRVLVTGRRGRLTLRPRTSPRPAGTAPRSF
jgi:hypothetical protein